MDRNPEHAQTHVLNIHLRPKWTEKKIPRTDEEIARAFEYTEARVTKWSEIGIDINLFPQVKASFDKRDDVLDKSSAGTVVVYAVLRIPELFGMYRICPLAGPILDTPTDPEEWKGLLDLHINLGWPVDCKTSNALEKSLA